VAATEGSMAHGIILLLVYSLGLGIPFFISALAMHQFMVVFNRFKKFIRVFEICTGLFLILIGILIFTNGFAILSGYAGMLFKGIE